MSDPACVRLLCQPFLPPHDPRAMSLGPDGADAAPPATSPGKDRKRSRPSGGRKPPQQLHQRPPAELVVRREILLDPDRELAWRLGSAARGALTGKYAAYNAPDRSVDYRHLAGADQAEERAREAYLFTDPAGAIAELRALAAAGITKVVLRMQWYDLPQDRMLRSLELFRDEVLPAFRTA